MSLLQQIKDDQLQARFNKDKLRSNLLTTLWAEAAIVGKNQQRDSTDEEVVAVIQKFIKNLNEFAKVDPTDQSKQEINILQNYLPDQLTDEELSQYVDILVAGLPEKSMKSMGSVMSEMNKKFPGQFDRAKASQMVKAALS